MLTLRGGFGSRLLSSREIIVIDEKKLLGFATAMAGSVALVCAAWTRVPANTILILLFLLSCLVGYLSGNIRYQLTLLLVCATAVSELSFRDIPIPSPVLPIVLGSVMLGVVGVQLGTVLRRKFDRFISSEN